MMGKLGDSTADNNTFFQSDSRGTALLSPRLPASHRHSAPSLFRNGWRRRSTSPFRGHALLSTAEVIKGPLGLNLLYEPSEPWVDFIFVHGLHGGSRKTWSSDPEDQSTFWPEQWLPHEAGFKHVRIHSFGYDSDWSKSQHSTLRIRDFAQALLATISNSQLLKKTGNTPIVFIAHSMGGLVVKQAYLFATRDATYKDVASRIHSIYFMATPHRGADSAAFIKTYLSLSLPSGSKSYVKELLPDSQTVQDINEDFRHVCGNVQIWSFFEGIPTAGIMIVKKASAVIGMPGERSQYIQADHRHICKFRSVTDANYVALCECFKTTIEEIERNSAARQAEQVKLIAHALDISQRPAIDLVNVEEKRYLGTCEWMTTHPGFHTWVNVAAAADVAVLGGPFDVKSPKDHRFLWLNGPPGSGKSVTAGHVIDYLSSYNLDCSYYFFKNDSKATISQLLLSLAFQMAESNYEIRQTLLDLLKKREEINTQDHTVIWNNLFLGRLFKTSFSQPQFWVIDALDECPKKSLKSLIQKLAKIDPAVPLRIFITSRPDSPEAPIRQLLDEEKIERIELQTGQSESMGDIEAYIRSRPRLSRLLSEGGDDSVISDILAKTKGIFLWASLITARLEELYSIEDIKDSLGQVPSEMNGFYTRILDSITESPNAEKAKCILKWVVCAPAPMTKEELKEAVRLDIGHTLLAPNSSDIYSEICGSLVTVDKKDSSHVELMHQTVREFLTSSASNFYVNRQEAHEKIAATCLDHLNGRSGLRRASRRPGPGGSVGRPGATNAFADYASFNFSYHLCRSHSTAQKLLCTLVQFITTKSLVWIETVARKGKLGAFIRTIQNLKPYLAHQLEKTPPFDSNYLAVSTWIEDLTRLVAIFGRALVECPDSIHAFIAPLCPRSSIMYQTFAKQSPQKVICSFNEKWEERLSCIVFPSTAKAVAASEKYVAAGLANGQVRVFDSSTLEEKAVIEHGKTVKQVAFGNVSNILASLSPKELTLWDSQYTRLWTAPISSIGGAVSFNANDSKIFVTLKGDVKHVLLVFNTKDGSELEPFSVQQESSDSDSDDSAMFSRTRYNPEVVCLSTVLGLVATTHRSSPLTIFSLDDEDYLEKVCQVRKKGFEKYKQPPQVTYAVFNPAVESDLIAIAYQDGDIITMRIGYNPSQVSSYRHQARALASSPDGRTLAAGDTEGGVSLFVFDTLRLMHRISALEEAVTGIMFASNSLRLYDIRGRYCNIWEPPALVRKASVDDNTTDPEEAAVTPAAQPLMRLFDDDRSITVMESAGDDKFLFCGREDGSVSIHDIATGKQVVALRLHAVDIRELKWQHGPALLVSTDTSRRCVGTRLCPPAGSKDKWRRLEQVFSFRVKSPVNQTLVRPDGLAVLVSTESGEELWQDGKITATNHSPGNSRWLLHPTDETRLLLVHEDRIHLYRWEELERETQEAGVQLVLPPQIVRSIKLPLANGWKSRLDTSILIQTLEFETQSSKLGFLTLNVDHIQPQPTQVIISCTVRCLFYGMKETLAVTRSNLFFLDRGGWICSLSLKSISDARYYIRHFFIPPFWRTGGGGSIVKILSKNSLAIAYRDDLVIVHGFLEYSNKVLFDDTRSDDELPLAYRTTRER